MGCGSSTNAQVNTLHKAEACSPDVEQNNESSRAGSGSDSNKSEHTNIKTEIPFLPSEANKEDINGDFHNSTAQETVSNKDTNNKSTNHPSLDESTETSESSKLPLPDIVPVLPSTSARKPSPKMESSEIAEIPQPVSSKGKSKNKFADLFERQESDVLREIRERLNQLLSVREYTPDACSSDLEFLMACTRQHDAELRSRKQLYCDEMAKSSFVRIFRKLFEQNFNSRAFDSGKKYQQMMKMAVVILWNGTDVSTKLCDDTVNARLYEDLLRYLDDPISLPNDEEDENLTILYITKGFFGILHNLLQTCDVRDALRRANAVEIMKKYRNASNMMLKCKAEFNLAYVVSEEEYARLNANAENIKFIISILKASLKSTDHFSKRFGYRSSEVVSALNKLAANDDNKEHMVKEGILSDYTQLLEPENSSEEEQKLAANGIWMLSFKGKDAILREPNCVDRLRHLAENSFNNDVKKAANGALWILDGKEETSVEKAALQQERSAQGHVMISYNWGSQPTMLKVRDRLKQEGYQVWMDVENMTGSILDTMAKAIEDSLVVIVCVSQKYKESPNCRTEAEYAYRLNKKTIPLLLQKGYRADGWLGALLGTKLYFDLSKEERFESSLENFIVELKRAYGETIVQPQTAAPTGSAPGSSSQVSGAASWTHPQVVAWLNKHGLGNVVAKFDGMDGSLLVEFACMRRDAADFFYTTLRDQMRFSLIDILKFTKALKEI